MPTDDQPFDNQYGGGQETSDETGGQTAEHPLPTLEPEMKEYVRGKPYREVIRARIVRD
jgi:hypothetical protein